jgi:hypothetical protein
VAVLLARLPVEEPAFDQAFNGDVFRGCSHDVPFGKAGWSGGGTRAT